MQSAAVPAKSAAELAAAFSRLDEPQLYAPAECERMAATIERIHALKRERNALVQAHNY